MKTSKLVMKELDLTREEENWEKEKELIKRKKSLKAEKLSTLLQHKKPSTTKLLIGFLFLNCTAIELFTGWTTVQSIRLAATMGMTVDFTPLVTLIGAVVGEVIGYAIYAIKSTKENTVNGITYLKAQHDLGISTKEDIQG